MNEMMRMQLLCYDWGIRCFGKDHMQNRAVRALRLVEEAVEAAQVCNTPKEQLHQLIDVVYSRPHGTLRQELGGVLVTTGVLAVAAIGESLDQLLFDELQRCLSKDPAHFTQRNEDKIQLGLSGEAA
jgi:hypothetical protein